MSVALYVSHPITSMPLSPSAIQTRSSGDASSGRHRARYPLILPPSEYLAGANERVEILPSQSLTPPPPFDKPIACL